MTYSLVARDVVTGELGVAVQSRAFGTGAAVPWARAGVGAVATQSFTHRGYGVRGLDLMEAGAAPFDALAELLAVDDQREYRQVAFLAADGGTAAHTGALCVPEAGHISRDNVSAQGNMLRSRDVCPALVSGFEAAAGSLATRLLAALNAAEDAGGDFRGKEAAGLVVVPAVASAEPWNDRVFDLRVDSHPDPLAELGRLHRLAAGYRRRNRIGPGASVEEEVEAASQAGLPELDVALAAAFALAHGGDLDAAAYRLTPLVAADPRWLQAFDRYERLGALPAGVVDRLGNVKR
jgi:uncharacterized Ntn-hydrolase superfamily protein